MSATGWLPGVQIGDGHRVAGGLAEQRERRLGPQHIAGEQVLLPAADPAQPLGLLQQRAEPLYLVGALPGDHHAVIEAGDAHIHHRGGHAVADRGADDLTGDALRLAVGQHLAGAVIQPAVQGGRRVGLEQRPAQDARGVTPGRVGEALAEVADPEVGQLPAVIPHRPGVHGRPEQAVQQAEGPPGPVVRGQGAVRQPYRQRLRAQAGDAPQVAPHRLGEVTEGKLGGQAQVPGVAGTWKDLTESVNAMADNLTGQVRDIAQVATAVARGDLSQKITVDVKGEMLALKDTLNTMVDQLSAFADEVTRVAREVGTEGRLGGQAQVPGVGGTWRDLTDSVNFMAGNLTSQVRNIALVTTAVAQGDLSKKIDVDARGEILELKTTINTMVDQLSAFAAEVTRVAREVGSKGRLGGQAEVEGVSGTWKRLTENVNELAGNLTRQVRAIAEVTSAVATGDLTRSITVEAEGEVAELKDNINAMVHSLRETTKANQEQYWLKTNLAPDRRPAARPP